MAKVDRSRLHRGDILIFEWVSGFWHTAIYNGDDEIAHCEGLTHGTAIDSLAEYYGKGASAKNTKNLYAFRIPGILASALTEVMLLANKWALKVNTTLYGAPRGSAVLKEYDRDHPGTAPVFEYDALFRVFKWLDKDRNQFSEKQGTTCCAFVLACFQAGMMKHFLDQQGADWACPTILHNLSQRRAGKTKPNLSQTETIFRDELRRKSPERSEKSIKSVPFDTGEAKKIQARKQYSNPGSKEDDYRDVNTLWEKIKTDDCYLQNNTTTLDQIFSTPLFCDAKFTYSRTLYQRLSADQAWTQVQGTEE